MNIGPNIFNRIAYGLRVFQFFLRITPGYISKIKKYVSLLNFINYDEAFKYWKKILVFLILCS